VIALDPEHVEAGRPLSELYFESQQWNELSPVIDMLCRKASQLHADQRELNDLYYRAAKTADELGDLQKALGYYKYAYDIDSTHLRRSSVAPTCCSRWRTTTTPGRSTRRSWSSTATVKTRRMSSASINRLGMVRQALGERKKALNMFEKALEIDRTIATRCRRSSIYRRSRATGRRSFTPSGPCRRRRTQGEGAAPLRGGRRLPREAPDPQKATAAYLEALEVAPEDHQLLQKLLDLYTETKQWKKVVETIERFIALESDAVRRGAYYTPLQRSAATS